MGVLTKASYSAKMNQREKKNLKLAFGQKKKQTYTLTVYIIQMLSFLGKMKI